MYRAVVGGIGSYVPSQRLSNFDLERMVDTSDEWIRAHTGISERRIASSTEATSDFAYQAARNALEDAGLTSADIGIIIVATETPDHIFPPVACQIQKRLGCRNVGAFDIHATCVGFLSGLQLAKQYIQCGTPKHILVIGADSLSRFTDYTDRTTCILFADGAGAFVVSQSTDPNQRGIISTTLHSDGEYFDSLYIPGGGSRHPYSGNDGNKAKIVMDGRKIFKQAVTVMSDTVEEILIKTGYSQESVSWLIPHQANQRIIDAVARNLGFPDDKVISTIENYGNNSSATIPLAVDCAVRDGRIHRGDILMLVAFGGGMVWGGALVQY